MAPGTAQWAGGAPATGGRTGGAAGTGGPVHAPVPPFRRAYGISPSDFRHTAGAKVSLSAM